MDYPNTVLAHRGAEAYEDFTHGGGFYRNFFATLKGGADRTGGGGDRAVSRRTRRVWRRR